MGWECTGGSHCYPQGWVSIFAYVRNALVRLTELHNRATSQLILLPGNDYTSAETFISNGSADALAKVTNPDGSITGLIFDVHKYLDSDNSCVPWC